MIFLFPSRSAPAENLARSRTLNNIDPVGSGGGRRGALLRYCAVYTIALHIGLLRLFVSIGEEREEAAKSSNSVTRKRAGEEKKEEHFREKKLPK